MSGMLLVAGIFVSISDSPAWVRAGKFDVRVTKNRGLDTENFQTEAAALEGLLQPPPAIDRLTGEE